MSDMHRCKAHYRRGVAFENRADYERLHGQTPECSWPVLPSHQSQGVHEDLAGYEERTNHIYLGDGKFIIKPNYHDAAKDLYFALQLSPNDQTIKQALQRVDD
jgi:hypothetical protein